MAYVAQWCIVTILTIHHAKIERWRNVDFYQNPKEKVC